MPTDEAKEWATSLASTKALVSSEASTVYSEFFKRWVRVIRVGKAITSDYRTISDALSHSERGDRIEVESGSYYESVAIPHSVELTTADIGEEVLISTRGPCITIATDEPVMISRLTVIGRGQRQADSVAILIVRGSPMVKDCLLSAIHVSCLATPTVTHCTIQNSESGCGLRLTDHCGGEYSFNEIRFHRNECVKIACCGKPVFKKNRIYQKRPLMAVVTIAGGRYGAGCAPLLEDNLISGSEHMSLNAHTNTMSGEGASALFDRPTQLLERNFSVPDGLIAVSWNASPTLKRNTLVHGAVGIHLAECFLPDGQFEENRILHCTSWGIYLGRNAVALCYNNEVSNNAGGVRSHAASSIVHKCTISHNAFYGVMVMDAAPTFENNTIDGSECGAVFLKNCTGMKFEGNTLRQNIICAIEVVKQCQCRIERNFVLNNRNAGILVSDNSTAELDGNVVKENDTNIFIRGQSVVHMIRNTVCKAMGHSVLFMEQSAGIMEHNDISESPSMALVAIVQRSSPEIRGNFIRAGASSGILVEGRATPYIHGNQISSLRDGIRVRDRGDPVCEENDIQSCTHGLLCEEDGLSLFVRNVLRTCSHAFVTSRSGGHPTVRGNDCRSSATYGFSIEDGGQGEFEKNDVRDCATGLCHVAGPSSDARIVWNHFTGSSGFGVVVDHFAKATITRNVLNMVKTFALGSTEDGQPTCFNNHVVSSEGYGIQCKGGSGTFHDNVVEGCCVAGALVKSGSTAAFRSNMFSSNGGNGIVVSKGSRCTFDSDTVELNEGSGVMVDGDANATELRGLIIQRNVMHGIKVVTSGSCVFTGCTVSDNGGDGVYLSSAGDAQLHDCKIRNHGRCVVCREGGQAVLEACTLSDASGDSVVYVIQGGNITLSQCTIRDGLRSGIKLASRGTAHCRQCSIRCCAYTGLECHADTSVKAVECQVEDCANGVVFAARTSVVEARDTAKTVYAAAAQEASDAMRRRSTRVLKRSTSLVAVPSLQVSQSENNLVQRSPSISALSRLSSAVTVVVADVETISPVDEMAPLHPAHISGCTFFNIKEHAILCLGGSRGLVTDTHVNYCSGGIFLEANAGVVCRAVMCTKSHSQGILVEGTPDEASAIEECVIRHSIGLGAVLRGVQAPFSIVGCVFEENVMGGMVIIDTSCNITRCVVRGHETFGMWFSSCAHALVSECTLDTNKENNAVLVGDCSPTFEKSVVRNGEHGFAVLEGAAVTIRDCVVAMNRIAIAVYEKIQTLDQPAPLSDTDWNERFRAGALRRRSSVGAMLKTLTMSGTLQRHSSVILTDAPPHPQPIIQQHQRASRQSTVSMQVSTPAGGDSNPAPPSACRPSPPDASAAGSSTLARGVLCEGSTLEHNSVGIDAVCTRSPVHVTGCKISACMTHGAALHAGASVTIDKCSLQGCGAAVLCHTDALGTITDTTFSQNRVGLYLNGNSRTRVTASNFVENSDTGILVTDQVVSAIIEKNVFTHNARCGMDVAGRSILSIARNVFEEEPLAIRVRDRAAPIVSANTFKECTIGIEVVGLRTKPRVLFNEFHGNQVAISVDDKGEGDIARNIFRTSRIASIDVSHHGDPTIVQNLFEEHTDPNAVAVRIGINGSGVVGNNKFINNSYGLRAGCNAEHLVVMLNAFEQQTVAAVQFTEAAAGALTRNQFHRNPKMDIHVIGGPSLAGLSVDRNGLVVSGTGIVVEGRCVNPCVVRENRLFGSTGIGISCTTHGMALMSNNLLHCLDVGIQFAAGGLGTLSGSIIAGCRIGVHALAGSSGTVEDSTLLANSTHAVQVDEEARLTMSSCRLGYGPPQKPLASIKGGGEISACFFFNAHIGAQMLEHSSMLLHKSAVQSTRMGVMFMPGSKPTVKTNCISRNEIGVCITSLAGGALQENSIYTNTKFALQATTPHSVLISKNFFSQDNEIVPSISGLSAAEIALVAKANTAVGHGGRSDGTEKYLVPPSVSRSVPRDDVLLAQFHKYLNELAVPPTDSSSAAVSEGAREVQSSGFNYGGLLSSLSHNKNPVAFVVAAEERILDVMDRLDGSGVYKATATKEDVAMKRLAKVTWDVGQALASRSNDQVFSWGDAYYGGEESDEDEDSATCSAESDDVNDAERTARRVHKAQRRAARSTVPKTSNSRRSGGSRRSPGKKSSSPSSTPAGAILDIAKRNKDIQDALLEELRKQEESEIALQKVTETAFSERQATDGTPTIDGPPDGLQRRHTLQGAAETHEGSERMTESSHDGSSDSSSDNNRASGAPPGRAFHRNASQHSSQSHRSSHKSMAARQTSEVSSMVRKNTSVAPPPRIESYRRRSVTAESPAPLKKTLRSFVRVASARSQEKRLQEQQMGLEADIKEAKSVGGKALKSGEQPPAASSAKPQLAPKAAKRGGITENAKKPPQDSVPQQQDSITPSSNHSAAADRLSSCKGVWLVMQDGGRRGSISSAQDDALNASNSIATLLHASCSPPNDRALCPDAEDGQQRTALDDLRIPIVATSTSGRVLSAADVARLAKSGSGVEAVIIIPEGHHRAAGISASVLHGPTQAAVEDWPAMERSTFDVADATADDASLHHSADESGGDGCMRPSSSMSGGDIAAEETAPRPNDVHPPLPNPLHDIQLLVERRLHLNSLWHRGLSSEERESLDLLDARSTQLNSFFELLSRGSRIVLDLDELQSGDEAIPANRRHRKSVYAFANSLNRRLSVSSVRETRCSSYASQGDGVSVATSPGNSFLSHSLGISLYNESAGDSDAAAESLPLPPTMEVRRRLRAMHRQPGKEWLSTIHQSRGDILAILDDQARSFREGTTVKTMLSHPTPPVPQSADVFPLHIPQEERRVSVQEALRPGSGSTNVSLAAYRPGVAPPSGPSRLDLKDEAMFHAYGAVGPLPVLPPCETPTRMHPRCHTRTALSAGEAAMHQVLPDAVSEGTYHTTQRKAVPALVIAGAPVSPMEQRINLPAGLQTLSPAPPRSIPFSQPNTARVGSGNPFWTLPSPNRRTLPSTPRPRPISHSVHGGKRLPVITAASQPNVSNHNNDGGRFDITRPHETSPYVRIGFTPLPHAELNMGGGCR